jgi:murein L,D-transpeptidase YafK
MKMYNHLFKYLIVIICTSSYVLAKTKQKIIKTHHPLRFDSIVVIKHLGTLCVYSKNKMIKTYKCGTGSNPIGHKQKRGDNRTPEGIYHITNKNAHSNYYKNLHIDYPNTADRLRCAKAGLDPGGDIKIHGTAKGFAKNVYYGYTWGCVGVCKADMNEPFESVLIGAVINILP